MRVTQKIIYDDFLRDITRNRTQMAKIQSDLSSGKSVRLPSDNPINFVRSRNIEENLRKAEQYQDNLSSGLRQGRLAQEAVDEVLDLLIETKRLATGGATASNSETARISMADQIRNIRDSMVASLNSSYGDRYLFGGTNSSEPPFVLDDTQPSGVQSLANNKAPSVAVADSVRIDISISGREITDLGNGENLFQLMADIEQALRDNDGAAVNGQLSRIDAAIDSATIAISRLGGNLNRMEFMFEQYESTKIVYQTDVSRLVDTDFAEAISQMQRTQTAYEASMAVQTRMINNTLLDYI
ncbi:MAG: hypothetical protein JJU41_09770 [Bacteroidetes bacterium]|nr:hypothetical protein [Bacteroidota bacterium]MCH8524211.1 hypothetical protein [Balneolales bacterium]